MPRVPLRQLKQELFEHEYETDSDNAADAEGYFCSLHNIDTLKVEKLHYF